MDNLSRVPALAGTRTARRQKWTAALGVAPRLAAAGLVVLAGLLPSTTFAQSAPYTIAAPPPPEQPTLQSAATKYTTRLYGNSPAELAVAVTQHIYTAAVATNAPNEDNNDGDRPWGLTLITPDDPLVGISATELIHFPDDAPILFVNSDGIPQVTLDEIKRLGDTGILRNDNIDVFAVGAAANPAVLSQLQALNLKVQTITAPDIFSLANQIDQVYGQIQNPDTGVPQMATSASTGGAGVMDVFIGSVDAWQYALPATHWVSHMPGGMLWVNRDSVPQPTLDALKRRMGRATIYVYGGPDEVSPAVVKQLNQYGSVTRITNDDGVAYNQPPTDDPISTSIAFAKMWDPVGMVGWNITGPGHGFTLVNVNNWQAVVGSAILSHLGFHAPLLLTNDAATLPSSVQAYLTQVAPGFRTSPADGPYNMTYVVGSYQDVSWPVQARVDQISGMANARVWSQAGGQEYVPPR
jgi:hypothetical protein